MNETTKCDSTSITFNPSNTNFTFNPANHCWYRLPCGICTRTNQMCPMGATRDGYIWERHSNITDIIDKLDEIIDKLN